MVPCVLNSSLLAVHDLGCVTTCAKMLSLGRSVRFCNILIPAAFYLVKGSILGDEGQIPQDKLQQLVQKASQGDAGAFGKLYDVYLDTIYRYVYYKVGARIEAEDLTSQIFVKAWEAMPRYQWREIPFSHWLMRLARNAVIDHYRTARVHGELEEDLVSQDPGPHGHYLRGERARDLEAAIRQLPEDQRAVIVMRFIEEMDYAEVAAITGKSPGALRVAQHRALAALRKMIEREEQEGVQQHRGGAGRVPRQDGDGRSDARGSVEPLPGAEG